jgi:hypothetical protein
MSANKITKSNKVSFAMQVIAGTNKHFPNASQEIAFGGATRTVSATTALFQSYVDLRNATLAAQAGARTKLSEEEAEAPPILAVLDEYVAFVRATVGNQPDVLSEFGLAPHKGTGTQSAVQKAAAAVKRAATRKARHTMGKNQKKDVTGGVTGVLVTPILAPSPVVTPAGASSPATPAGAGNATAHGT